MNQLHEYELFELEEVEQEEQRRFEITGLDSLNWAFRKIAALNTKAEDITALAKAEHERINEWEKREKDSIAKSLERLESLVTEYHMKVLEQDPKAKTLSTPYGKSKAASRKAQPEKLDEKQILSHVVENELPYTEPKLKWSDLKKNLRIVEKNGFEVVVDENGQVVPGAAVKPAGITYSVEVVE
jgi:Bacteriophage Mu Gam like protein